MTFETGKHKAGIMMAETGVTVQLNRVSKSFGDFTAVKELSVTVRAGRVFGLLGPNGAGKTTTIRMIVNITAPDSGKIELFGGHINSALQDRIGYLPEERGLYRRMKIVDQLRFFAELKNVRGKEVETKIDQWLARVKLSEWKNKRSMELSKGMQQKIQFVTAVLHDPDLLILDEPFSGLDPINLELLKEIVLDLKRSGKTIIFSTHQMEVAEKLCDDICLLNRSQKVFEGSLREIKSSFGRNAVAVRCEGGDGVLDDPTLVSKLVRHADEAQALLAEGADAQVLLRRLIDSGARIGKFEMVEPSLNDIFITKVTEHA
ncbi:MAG TPA: ATP-binding cassette domain-containing protein [Pyrinomonadaceae bacterium]|nr:ATP-binding cassette domain-containing protein [Pyrinomonadaceae bacterium]